MSKREPSHHPMGVIVAVAMEDALDLADALVSVFRERTEPPATVALACLVIAKGLCASSNGKLPPLEWFMAAVQTLPEPPPHFFDEEEEAP